MKAENQQHLDLQPIGYTALLEHYKIDSMPNWHRSFIATNTNNSQKLATKNNGIIEEVYAKKYWLENDIGGQLEFTIKYDGINLAILAILFEVIPENIITEYIKTKPTGKYVRKLWFIYEFLTDKALPIANLKQGNYIALLDKELYFTSEITNNIKRQRINNNLLGNKDFCPTIRRTNNLTTAIKLDVHKKCSKLMLKYPEKLLHRALRYLYSKETKSSFEIEHIKINPTKTEKFISLLKLAEEKDFCEKAALISIQNQIVDPRFKDAEYRTSQNYVGETITRELEKIHFISPKPEDLAILMQGLIASHKYMHACKLNPVLHAAAISYGFVFMHPFEDGNGRIHRFLLHNILALRQFIPEGLMFPISATMLKNSLEYDKSLESFSDPLVPLIDYSLDYNGIMQVKNNTIKWYNYIDMTAQAEALFEFIEKTIEIELTNELDFLLAYDNTKKAIKEIIDMPDRKIDLFIRFFQENDGKLSKNKRQRHFSFLSETEITDLEKIIKENFNS